jgi:hypothetical protein
MDECRHAHGDDDAGRLAGQLLLPQPSRRRLGERESGPEDLLEEGLQQRGHGSQPQRVEDQQMIGRPDHVLAAPNVRRHGLAFERLLGAQDGECQFRDADHLDPMPGLARRPPHRHRPAHGRNGCRPGPDVPG